MAQLPAAAMIDTIKPPVGRPVSNTGNRDARQPNSAAFEEKLERADGYKHDHPVETAQEASTIDGIPTTIQTPLATIVDTNMQE